MSNQDKNLTWEELKKEIEEKIEKDQLTEDDPDYGIYLLYWAPMGIYLYDKWKEKKKRQKS